MIDPNIHSIAEIKLGELRRQRDRLVQHYADLENAQAAAGEPLDQLKILYDGLREARFAQRSLHPDVANLEVLLLEGELGTASAEMLDQWIRKLQRERDQGRLRSEFSYVFGRLLTEWMAARNSPPPQQKDGASPIEEKLRGLWEQGEENLDLGLITQLLQRYDGAFERVREEIRTFAEKEAGAAVTTEDVKGLLHSVSNDMTRKPELRQQAMALVSDEMQVNEYAGAVTILLNNLVNWDWPPEGFYLRTLWSRTRWRPYLDEDLLSLLFHHLVGFRWGIKLKSIFQSTLYDMRSGVFEESSTVTYGSIMVQRSHQHSELFMSMVPDSMEELGSKGSYEGSSESDGLSLDNPDPMQKLLLFVNAEINLARASQPDQPLFVIQADLQDFYLRIPHRVVTCLIENLGFPEPWSTFFSRSLAVPVRYKGNVHTIRRGILLDHPFSDAIAECLLLFLDLYVNVESGVRPLRMVDDLFLLTHSSETALRAWKVLHDFCRACGLEVNSSKSGSACVGGANLPELPAKLPRWGFLQLQVDGSWSVDREALEEFQALIRQQLDGPQPVLDLISLYNASLRYLLKFLGLSAPLGIQHREQAARALTELHSHLFEEHHGVAEEVRRRLSNQFLAVETYHLPEALLYWPITAGGLGLFHPLAAAAVFHSAALQKKDPRPPLKKNKDWLTASNQWSVFYVQWLQPVYPRKPDSTPGMEALLADFVARSSEVAGKASTSKGSASLGVYWQWIVYTYGPQLVESLGTFRFLITELVPLQLIVQNRIDASSLREAVGVS